MSVLLSDISRYGPQQTEKVSLDAARAYCRRLAKGRYENFSVLSPLVPRERRDDFAAVYAFARWADDLGDEAGSPQRACELLAWWRGELTRLMQGDAQHPVFVALQVTIAERGLDVSAFEALLRAFELDQVKTRYETWNELVEYCQLSANPVGRLVLSLLNEPCTPEQLTASDAVCTALQLTNHWQDIRRDFVERGRIYVPADMHDIDDFSGRLARTIKQGYSCDATFFGESRRLVRRLVAKTWAEFDAGEALLTQVSPSSRPLVWLFSAGGRSVLRTIERWNCETVMQRPVLSAPRKCMLVARAVLAARCGLPLPALPYHSEWIIDPDPDPQADQYPRARSLEPSAEPLA